MSRIVVGWFWLLVIVMVCLYSANLMVSLTVSERKMPFTTVAEASQEDSVEFYTDSTAEARNMLQVSNIALYLHGIKRTIP